MRKRKRWLLLKPQALESLSIISAAIASLGLALTLLLSGCSKQQFVQQQYTASVQAAGSRVLPSKIDILIVPDNTASINTAFSTVQSELAGFVSSLQAIGSSNYAWDYHIARAVINNPSPITQVLVNPTYNSSTLPDGTSIPTTGLVPPESAVTDPASFPLLEGTNQTGGDDYTYSNIFNTLVMAKNNTTMNFLRPDAPLAIIVITNGADFTVDPNHDNQLNLSELQYWANQLAGIKGSSSLVRFYPVASYAYHSGYNGDNCLVPGGTAWIGSSYFAMNTYIPGLSKYDNSGNETLDFCNMSSLTNVLSDIAANLTTVQQKYVYSDIVLDERPIPSSIQISVNGSSIPQDKANGWSYPCDTCDSTGFGTVYTITAVQSPNGQITPISPGLSRRTGYVIQLNGSARIIGSQQPSITYEKQ